ncbi:MAG: hypothetical protein ACF8OB_08030 [Phycisphaeraceae bacterium JB051]
MQWLIYWFWQLIPANPILMRIVHGGSRRVRHLWVRMGYVGVMVMLVMLALASGGGIGQDISMTALAKAGAHVFAQIAYGQVILICLLSPLFMAGAISAEQQGKTFDIMLTTPLSNLQIVFGSLLGRLYFVLALLISGLPLFSVLLIFGGVPVSAVFVSFAVAGLSALLMGAVAVTLSVMRIGGRKAVVGFVIGVAGYLVAGYMIDVTLLRNFPIVADGTNYLTPLHPILVLQSYLDSANYHAPSPDELVGYSGFAKLYLCHPFGVFATVTTLLSVSMLTFCSLWVRMIGQGQSQWVYKLKKKLRIGKGQGERRRQPRSVWINPIAWREASTRGKVAAGILGKWAFVILGWSAGALLIWLYHSKNLPSIANAGGRNLPQHEVFRNILATLLIMELAVICLVALYMSASCVSREREDRTLDLILTTPVTPKLYIWGKLRGLVSFLTMMLTVPVVTLAMVSAYTWIGRAQQWPQAMVSYGAGNATATYPLLSIEAALLLLLMLVPFVGFCVMVGMNWSVKSKGVLGAVIWSVGILSAISMVLGFCGWSAAANIPVVGPIINSFSPVTHMLVIINPYARVHGMMAEPIPGRWNLIMGAALAAVGYSVMVYILLLNIVRNFDQTVRQLSGNG